MNEKRRPFSILRIIHYLCYFYFRSTASGVFLLLARIGAIMGTYIFGLFTSTSHVAIPVLLTAAILLSSAVLSLFLPRTTRKTALK